LLSIIQAAGWPIWPLIACSVLALALICERFISLKTARIAPPSCWMKPSPCRRVPAHARRGEPAGPNSALGEVLASGLRALNNNPQCSEADLRATMEGAAAPWPTGWKST
jgi:biopolymer transport protein ExbB